MASKKTVLFVSVFVLISVFVFTGCDGEITVTVESVGEAVVDTAEFIVDDVTTGVEEIADAVEDISADMPRFGDGMKIGEALEKATCESQGGTWSPTINRCKS